MDRPTSMRMLATLLSVLSLPIAQGCYTGIKAKEVTANSNAEGLRYFLPVPYLVVQQTGDAKWDAHIDLGVDRSREFTVQPYAYFAKGTTTIAFNDDGTLKSFKLAADSTAVSEAVVTAVKDVQLKRLELQKAALDAALTKKNGGGAALVSGPKPGDRAFAVYRIAGDQVVGVPVRPSTQVVEGSFSLANLTGKPPETSSVAPVFRTEPKSLVVKLLPSGSQVTISLIDRDLTEADRAKLHFFTSSGAEKSTVANALQLDNGLFRLSKDQLAGIDLIKLDQ